MVAYHLVETAGRVCVCVYQCQCSSLPEFLGQRQASVEVVQSMQSLCMVSIIEPDSSSKYLGSNLKDYCFLRPSKIAQASAREKSIPTYLW